jgi:uncharacterized protein (TIGR04255 family)
MARLHYNRAPITEAIIDLQVKPRDGLTLSEVEHVRAGEEQSYPGIQQVTNVHGHLEVGERVAASAKQERTGLALASADNKQVAQARLDGFTFSRLAPYQEWESFRDEARRLWTLYRERTSPAEVTRLAVRYINRFDLPGPNIELKDFFRTTPEISPDLPQVLSSFFFRVVIPQDDLKGHLLISQTVVPPIRPDVFSVVLDIDLFRDAEVPFREDGIWHFFEQLHDRKNHVFEACITDRARELIR